MRTAKIVYVIMVLAWFASAAYNVYQTPHAHYSGKEWSMYVKTPACAPSQNVQVVFPAHPGDAVEIECDNVDGAK